MIKTIIKKGIYKRYKSYIFLKDCVFTFTCCVLGLWLIFGAIDATYCIYYATFPGIIVQKQNVFYILRGSVLFGLWVSIVLSIWFFKDSYEITIKGLNEEKLNIGVDN